MIDLLFYTGILLILAFLSRRISNRVGKNWLSRGLTTAASFCLLFATFIFWATPSINLPLPSGTHTVGLSHWVINTDRTEPFTLNPSDKRKLHIKVWYPTADVSNIDFLHYRPAPKLAAYASPNMAPVHAALIGSIGPLSFLEPRLKKALAEAKLSTYAGPAPLKTNEKFPVLLFSHGHRAHLDFFSTTMQDLASHGYIVIGINHSYEVPHSIMPTGETFSRTDHIMEHSAASDAQTYQSYEKQLATLTNNINNITSNGGFEANKERFAQAYNAIIDTPQDLTYDLPIRVADMLSTIQFMEHAAKQASASALLKMMDLSKVGAFGMSFGGPTSAEFCRQYGKCIAAANIDGKNWGDMLRAPLDVPMLWIAGTYTQGERFDVPYTLENWQASAFRVLVPGATHQAFTDVPFLSPLLDVAVLEFPYNFMPRGHREDIHRVTNGALVALFDHYAKDKAFNLNMLETALEGVIVEEYTAKINPAPLD
ncbi:MAG: hypothetical protein JKY34_07875 [Kordiimonadaceae bacterium]|nr:hypothetical protein [Kordiimonadaceae bacterium]